MPAVVVGGRVQGRPVVVRRVPASYPLAVAVITLAVVVAACTDGASRQRHFTLETTPYQELPQSLSGMKLPIGTAAVVALAGQLPERLAGRQRLPDGGWLGSERFVANWGDLTAWGTQSGLAGTPPVQIVIRRVETLGAQAPGSGGLAVMDDANRAVNIAGRLDAGRDRAVIWSRRADSGYTVALGRLDSPWLYVITASNERDLDAALGALTGAAGTHGGRPSTLR
jgi:hypothetical protein